MGRTKEGHLMEATQTPTRGHVVDYSALPVEVGSACLQLPSLSHGNYAVGYWTSLLPTAATSRRLCWGTRKTNLRSLHGVQVETPDPRIEPALVQSTDVPSFEFQRAQHLSPGSRPSRQGITTKCYPSGAQMELGAWSLEPGTHWSLGIFHFPAKMRSSFQLH